jgi:4-hydroxy-tetrahydrodipicolinate reductase
MKIGIIGCAGRMGKALIEQVTANPNCELSGGTVIPDSPFLGIDLGTIANIDPIGINAGTHAEELFEQSDAVIDFSMPSTSLKNAQLAATTKTPLVIGTTGFSDEECKQLRELGRTATLIWSANMSIGVNLLLSLIEKTAAILDDEYDIEVVEMHHCHKVDAPSGTALILGEAAARGRKVDLNDVAVKARDGIVGARKRGEIGFSTLRGGDVVGEHTVMFAGDGERIELTHKASNRKIFAKGAVRAALWSKNKEAGFYTIADVLA